MYSGFIMDIHITTTIQYILNIYYVKCMYYKTKNVNKGHITGHKMNFNVHMYIPISMYLCLEQEFSIKVLYTFRSELHY